MATITLYHYTSVASANGIKKSRQISASQQEAGGGGDAVFGSGVYLTSIAPHETSKLEILLNNFDGKTLSMLCKVIKANTSKVEKVVAVKLPKNEVEKVPSERDIYLVRGDIDLDLYEFDVLDGPYLDIKY